MDANLQSIDAAIFATLERLRDTEGGPFATVQRYLGRQNSPELDKELVAACQGLFPAALLAPVGTRWAPAPGLQTIALDTAGYIGTSQWRVFVVHSELAGHEEAIVGQVDLPGVLELVSIVEKRLIGLRIPGLYQNSRLAPSDSYSLVAKPGLFIYLVPFTARRFVDSVEDTDDSVPFEGIDGNVNLATPAVDDGGNITGVEVTDAFNPLVQFEVELEQADD